MASNSGTSVHLYPDQPLVTWDEYLALPWPCAADPATTALKAAQVHLDLFPDDVHHAGNPELNLFTVGAAMIAALIRMEHPIPAARSELTAGERESLAAAFLIERAAGIHPPALASPDRAFAYVVGQLSSQLFVQVPLAVKQVLVMRLLGWDAVDHAGAQAFASLPVGYEYIDADLTIAAVILAHGRKYPYFNLEASLRGLTGTRLRAEVGRAFFERVQLQLSDVSRVVRSELSGSVGLDTRTVAFWLENPLIHMGSGHYLLAPTRMLLDGLLLGVVLRALKAERERTNSESTPLAREFGRRFERYVGAVLGLNPNAGLVTPEAPFATPAGAQYSTTDFVVRKSEGAKDVLLLEAKLRGFRREVFAGSDLSAFHDAVREQLVPPLVQALKTIFNMQRHDFAVLESARNLCESTLRAGRITIGVVSPSFPTSLNCKQVHALAVSVLPAVLAEHEAEKASLRGLVVWAKEFLARRDVAWAWIQVADLEEYAGWTDAPDLAQLVAEFARDARSHDLVIPDRRSFAPTFNDWMRARGARGELHAATRATAGQFWVAMGVRAYGVDIREERELGPGRSADGTAPPTR
jgi:hypothetical protein